MTWERKWEEVSDDPGEPEKWAEPGNESAGAAAQSLSSESLEETWDALTWPHG